MSKVTLIARSVDISNPDNISCGSNPEELLHDIKVMSGKAAGVCYMPDDYLSEGMRDEEKAVKRAKFNSTVGHHSVYDHFHVSFIIECSKIMAMILNSTRLYSTSEKSARYTLMHPETELEQEKYEKWIDKFSELIKSKYPEFDDALISKLATENARYLISVFTPTVLEYTLPASRAILLPGLLRNFASDLDSLVSVKDKINTDQYLTDFYQRLATECIELAEEFEAVLNIDYENPVLKNHKGLTISLFKDAADIRFLKNNKIDEYEYDFNDDIMLKEDYSDNYTSTYRASFAELAQAQRHRTISYKVVLDSVEAYIPKILRDNQSLIDEWLGDFKELVVEAGVIPQGMLLDVLEEGRIEDFYLKAKERLCARAQLEIHEITSMQVQKFYDNVIDLSDMSEIMILNMINDEDERVICRCRFKDYTCNEPCKFKHKSSVERII